MPAWIAPLKPLISTLVLPPGLFVIVLLASLAVQRHRRRLGTLLLLGSIVLLWASQTVVAARWLQSRLLDVPPALTAADLDRLRHPAAPTAVLVLGGGTLADSTEYGGSAVLSELSALRLRYGTWLARTTRLPLGYSGGVGWGAGETAPETEAAAIAAQEWGVPLRWTESRSRDTRENARLSVPLLEAEGIREIVLVTEATHMPRAVRAFEAAAQGHMRITPAPTGFITAGESQAQQWLPSSRGQRWVAFILHEWLGMLAGA